MRLRGPGFAPKHLPQPFVAKAIKIVETFPAQRVQHEETLYIPGLIQPPLSLLELHVLLHAPWHIQRPRGLQKQRNAGIRRHTFFQGRWIELKQKFAFGGRCFLLTGKGHRAERRIPHPLGAIPHQFHVTAPRPSGLTPISLTDGSRLAGTAQPVPAWPSALHVIIDVDGCVRGVGAPAGLGQKCALATIVEVRGSIPSYESAKLLVREDGSMVGTIGGGCVEAEVWNAAREAMETEKPKHLTFSLGQDAAYDNGLICGGQLDVFVEAVLPLPHAFIFGAGHISKSLSKVATLAGFSTVVIDDRESFANRERFPEAAAVHAGEYEAVFPTLAINETSFVIIVTRGHRDDMRVLKLAVATPARYIAMIGSKRKVLNVVKELEKEGVPRARLRARSRAHGPGHRRHFAGGDRHLRGGRDDRRAPQRGIQLARAVDVGFRRRIAAGRAVPVSAAGLILAPANRGAWARPRRCSNIVGRRSWTAWWACFRRAARR